MGGASASLLCAHVLDYVLHVSNSGVVVPHSQIKFGLLDTILAAKFGRPGTEEENEHKWTAADVPRGPPHPMFRMENQ